MEFLEGGPCPGGIGRELTSHPRSFPFVLRSRPQPSTPGTSVTWPDGVGQVTSSRGSRAPLSHRRARPQQRLWEQVCRHGLPHPSGGTAASRGGRALVPPVVTLSWLPPQPRVDMCILTCCPGILSRVRWGGGWRGGVDGGRRLGWGESRFWPG